MSPLKIFEYMASGRAIVASDLPVLREVLNNRNAVLCEADNVDQWRQAIITLTEDRQLRQRLGAQARRDFDQHYSWSRRANFLMAQLQ
jgi:glycosyltransferase involved in cell wall biosynthesis